MTDTAIEYGKINNLVELVKEMNKRNIPANKRWKCLSGYEDYKSRINRIPLTGMFELTPFCNLDCKMCYVHLNKDQLNGSQLLSIEQWKNILKQAHSMGMMKACLTGGECLLYPDFKELYLYLEKLGIRPSIKTNGVLLDGEIFEFLKLHPPISVIVSLYGSSEDAYEMVTGARVFRRVIDNLHRLKEIKSPISITLTPSRFMYDDAKNLFALAESLGYPYYINYGLFEPRENTGRERNDLTIEEYIELSKLHRKLKGKEIIPPDDMDLPDSCGAPSQKYGLQCGAGRSTFCVKWNGSMCACSSLNDVDIDLLNTDFKEAWSIINKRVEAIPLPEECPDCPYYSECMHCQALQDLAGNPGHCNPEICSRTIALVKEGLIKI